MDPRTWLRDLTPYFLYILFVSTLGPLLFGFHLGELNAPQDVLTCKRKSIQTSTTAPTLPQCIPMNPLEFGVVSSMFTLGGLIGALGAGSTSSRYGRLKTMQINTASLIIGPVFEALAPNIGVIALGRLISGLGAGAAVVVVPIYIAEIAPPAEKGFFGSFTQVATNFGIFIAQLLGFFLSRGQYWRIILGFGGIIGVTQTVGLLFSSESPKWTADQGKPTTAKRTLRKLRGDKFDVDAEFTSWNLEGHGDLEEEEETLLNRDDLSPTTPKKPKKETVSMWQALWHPDYNKAVIAVIMVMFAQQLTGINSIVMYGVSLLADLLASNSALLNLAVSALNIIVTAGSAPLVDRLGRKTCILMSTTGMGVSSLLLAIGINRSIKVLSAIAVLTFVASFALGLGPVPFILSSELVGPEAVGATQSWALAANWIATFVVAQFFPIVNAALGGGKVYFIFAAIAMFFGLFITWWVPETKGKANADEVWGRERRED